VEVHPVTLDAVEANGQGVDAGQHGPGGEIKRVADRATTSEVGKTRTLAARAQPGFGELVRQRLADVEDVEVGCVVERNQALVVSPVDIE